eukprot:1275423-Heterocapsa_arctica.AAC.1
MAPAWAKANHWPKPPPPAPREQVVPAVELVDKVASLEQVKKFMLLAGWAEDDQAVIEASSRLEAAKQLKLEGKP